MATVDPVKRYKWADAAAIAWAQLYYKRTNDSYGQAEYSSLIYKYTVGKKTYYSFTEGVRFDGKREAFMSSPGPTGPKHKVPNVAVEVVGFILSHTFAEGNANQEVPSKRTIAQGGMSI